MEILNDFNTSVKKALAEIDPDYENLPGLVVCGTHSPQETEMQISKIKEARERKIPFLGICMGFELMLIEFARHVLGMDRANSLEIDPYTPYPIFTKLPELRVGLKQVGNRLESHWHNYYFNNKYKEKFDDYLQFVFEEGIMEIASNDYLIGVQFHPEYQSSKGSVHPILEKFIKRCHFLKGKNLQRNIEPILKKQAWVEKLGIKD